MEERDQTPPGWYDFPTADPQVQKDYEAALGAFLVTFNRTAPARLSDDDGSM